MTLYDQARLFCDNPSQWHAHTSMRPIAHHEPLPVGTAVLSSDDLLSVDPSAPDLAGAGFTFLFVVCMLEERQSNVRAVLPIPLTQTTPRERPFELTQRRLHQYLATDIHSWMASIAPGPPAQVMSRLRISL